MNTNENSNKDVSFTDSQTESQITVSYTHLFCDKIASYFTLTYNQKPNI